MVEISSSEDEDNDIELLPSGADMSVDEAGDGDVESSGNHVNDALNQHDSKGRVLVNIGHPRDEPDVFLSPRIAAVVKPHQV